MKTYILCLLSLLLFNTASATEVVELKLPKSDVIVIKLMFRNGSSSDPEDKKGLTNLTASTIIEGGTKSLTSNEIKDLVFPMAATYSVTVDKDVSVFTFKVHRDKLYEFYPVVRGLVLEPRFDDADFMRVKSNIQNYLDEVIRTSSDEEYSKKTLEDLLFRNTAYQHPVQGTSGGVGNSTLQDVIMQYNKWFNRNNLMIGIAGNYKEDFLELMIEDFSQLPDINANQKSLVIPAQPNGIEVEIISKPKAMGSAIFMGFPMDITRENKDFAALMIANSWLGEHRKSYSRLYQKIREERSMNYGDYSYIEWYNNGGSNMLPQSGYTRSTNYFSIWIRPVQTATGLAQQYEELKGITVGHAHFAIRMAIRELSLLIENGLSKEDFELTRTFLRSYIKLYAQTPDQQLGYLMDSRFYKRKDWLREADELLANVTIDEVNRAMKNYWQTSNMFISIVTDRSEAIPLAQSLRDNLPSPMSYSKTLEAVLTDKIRKEDEVVASFPLNVTSVTIVESGDTFR